MDPNTLKYFAAAIFLIFKKDSVSSAKKSKGDVLDEFLGYLATANLLFPFEAQ